MQLRACGLAPPVASCAVTARAERGPQPSWSQARAWDTAS